MILIKANQPSSCLACRWLGPTGLRQSNLCAVKPRTQRSEHCVLLLSSAAHQQNTGDYALKRHIAARAALAAWVDQRSAQRAATTRAAAPRGPNPRTRQPAWRRQAGTPLSPQPARCAWAYSQPHASRAVVRTPPAHMALAHIVSADQGLHSLSPAHVMTL